MSETPENPTPHGDHEAPGGGKPESGGGEGMKTRSPAEDQLRKDHDAKEYGK